MNNYVWFKPTELGLQMYVDYYKSHGFDHKLVLVNDKACLQFHNFVDVYGDYIVCAYSSKDSPFKHYEFYIDEEKIL